MQTHTVGRICTSKRFTTVTARVTSTWPSSQQAADKDGQISSFSPLLAHVAGKDLRSLVFTQTHTHTQKPCAHTLAGSSKTKTHDVIAWQRRMAYRWANLPDSCVVCSTLPKTLIRSLRAESKLKGQTLQLATLIETQPQKHFIISRCWVRAGQCQLDRTVRQVESA